MPLTTLAEYRSALSNVRQVVPITIGSLAAASGRLFDLWVAAVPAGAIPTAAVAPTSATVGALGQIDGLTQQSILGVRASATNPGNYIVVDRLSHQGGLSGTVTTAQTANLPTAAITRGTGVGVMIGLMIYSATGATTTTLSVTYTNSDGVGGRVSPLVLFGGTGNREAARMIMVPLESGDVGVNSVESVSLTGTTGTPGNFGVVLYRSLFVMCITDISGVLSAAGLITGNTFGLAPTVPDGACLSLLYLGLLNPLGAGALLIAET